MEGVHEDGAFNTTFMTGDEYAKWVENEEKRHQALMKEAGFLRQSTDRYQIATVNRQRRRSRQRRSRMGIA